MLCMELLEAGWVGSPAEPPIMPATPPCVNPGKNCELKYILLAAWAAEERENWSDIDMGDMEGVEVGGNIVPALLL